MIAENYLHYVLVSGGKDYFKEKSVKDVATNENVWINGYTGFALTTGYETVGIDDIYEVTFDRLILPDKLYITKQHKLGVWTKYDCELIELNNLKVGDYVALNNGEPTKTYIRQGIPIKSIQYMGKDTVGCISVPQYHKFVLNDIIIGDS